MRMKVKKKHDLSSHPELVSEPALNLFQGSKKLSRDAEINSA